jgi:hypothetical protein
MSKQEASELSKGDAEIDHMFRIALLWLCASLEVHVLGSSCGNLKSQSYCAELTVALDFVGASASSSSMLPSSLTLEKKRVVGHVSREGLASIVKASSRLILIDGLVL